MGSPSPIELANQAADRAMLEVPTLTDLVVKHAKKNGWKVFRVRQGKAGWNLGSGWPDLTLVRDGRLVFAELKREDKWLEPEQEEWYIELSAVSLKGNTVEVYVWRPSDWRLGHIGAVLAPEEG